MASASREATTSTAMMIAAPTTRAAITALSPTLPAPKVTKLSPGPTFSAFITAPAPVWMPQPSGPSRSSGMSLGTFTTVRSWASAYVPNDDWPKK